MSASRGGDGCGWVVMGMAWAWMAMARDYSGRAMRCDALSVLAVDAYTYGSSSARPGPVLVPISQSTVLALYHCPLPIPVATALYLTLPSSHLPRLLAVHPLLALRSAPYVLSARLSVTSPAPLPCDSTRHCPKRRVTLGRPVYYQSSTTSLHRGLLNSLHAASPLPQWTRKQR
jgi:hypothetical protein